MLDALHSVCASWPALLPPSRVSVSKGAGEILMIKRPGGASGYWSAAETPYMVEPLNMLASRRHSAVCFAGPAQSGKTAAFGEAWMAHTVVNDPGDMLIVQMTQDKAREYSKQRIDRAIRNSPKLHDMRSALSRDDNLHDKQFKNGMWLRIAWPTATNMASTSYRYTFGTDYDRWADDIDGEGDGFTLLGKRTTTFLSRGMTAVESSPGRPVTNPYWTPATPHEAPPVTGILGIYNRSDRRRWYWPCPHCREFFEAKPGLELFQLPEFDELLEDIRSLDLDRFTRDYAHIACPSCGGIIRSSHRNDMQQTGIWLPEGVTIDSRRRVSGTPRVSSIAGYWLGGVAAAYTSWEGLLRKQLQAILDYALTGSELPLQTTANTDQGVPYMSRHLAEASAGEGPEARQEKDMPRYVVPAAARFLVASVDVQGGKGARFVVQVHAIGEHQEQWLVDRYAITTSKRDGVGDEFAPLDPAAYPEDWDVLTEKVVQATYRLEDGEREMRVKLTVVDSGGEDGVTNNAYAWYRRLRKLGLTKRVRLTKGASTKADWHIRETMVGGKQGVGDIPLYLLETNKLKDIVAGGLQRRTPGPGYYHFPMPRHPERNPDGWLSQAFFDELEAEVRNERGVWEQVKRRNETLDLCVMIRAGCMMLKADSKEFWAHPPPWALEQHLNAEVITPEVRRQEKAQTVVPLARPVVERRRVRSSYLG